jgi:hypothetical protein
LYYLAVVTIRGGQTGAWFKGTFKALSMMPKMLSKRSKIQKSRRVSLRYFEDIIVHSEIELTRSRQRLISQETSAQSVLSLSKSP